jgi:hypothetical protein
MSLVKVENMPVGDTHTLIWSTDAPTAAANGTNITSMAIDASKEEV